jgi:hypothetical protein
MNVLAGLHGLNDASDLAPIFGCRVAHRQVLQGELVPERNRLFRARVQCRIVGKIPADALRTGFEINDCDTDVVRSFMN